MRWEVLVLCPVHCSSPSVQVFNASAEWKLRITIRICYLSSCLILFLESERLGESLCSRRASEARKTAADHLLAQKPTERWENTMFPGTSPPLRRLLPSLCPNLSAETFAVVAQVGGSCLLALCFMDLHQSCKLHCMQYACIFSFPTIFNGKSHRAVRRISASAPSAICR